VDTGAVSEQNLATAHRFTKAILSGDYEAAAAELDPEFEVDDRDIPESTGADSLFTWMARWDEIWESWRVEDLEIRAIGDARTISFFTMVAKGRGSGIELSREDAIVTEFRDGKLLRLGYYNDQAQAREAVGLQ
jgi:ketosteroid isomerase-like protein